MDREGPSLARVVGTAGITVYAIGDILGAGIYALVGAVAGVAGGASWASFLLAAVVAAITGLSYAEMVSRVPTAAGAASYCERAFGRPLLSFLVGFFVLASGLTSAATVSRAFVGYLDAIVAVPALAASVALLALLSALNYRGIRESTRANLVLTIVELGGLVVVIVAGLAAVVGGTPAASLAMPHANVEGVLAGATLAFFAYVGFEDTVNVAEEVRGAERAIPRAIVIAIAVTTCVYLAVVVLASLTVPPARLAAADAPLLEVLDAAGVRLPGGAFSIVAVVAIANTGLLNLIMASRMGYGMARQGLLPRALGRVHPRRRTPWVAVLAAFLVATALAASGGVEVLAQTTSLLLVLVFVAVHASLLVVKRRSTEPAPPFRVPRVVPLLGIGLCLALLPSYPSEAYLRAALVGVVGVLLYLLRRRAQRRVPDRAPTAPPRRRAPPRS